MALGRAGEGSYLRCLFREELLDWVESSIRDDLAPDVWAALECARREATEMRQQATQAEARHAQAQRDLDVLMQTLNGQVERRTAELARDNEALRNRLSQSDKEHVWMREKWEETLAENRKANNRIRELDGELKRTSEELVGLKARTFDLMVRLESPSAVPFGGR